MAKRLIELSVTELRRSLRATVAAAGENSQSARIIREALARKLEAIRVRNDSQRKRTRTAKEAKTPDCPTWTSTRPEIIQGKPNGA